MGGCWQFTLLSVATDADAGLILNVLDVSTQNISLPFILHTELIPTEESAHFLQLQVYCQIHFAGQ